MPLFVESDKVTLAASRGGWDGFVTQIIGGPFNPRYLIESPNLGDRSEGSAICYGVDIAAGPLTPPSFSVGEEITLYGQAGTITADHGDGTFTVEVIYFPTDHLTRVRRHTVPLWRLALENEG